MTVGRIGYVMVPKGDRTGGVLLDVQRERERHASLIASGKFIDYFLRDVPDEKRLAILAEEFGEAAKEVMEEIILRDKELPTPVRDLKTQTLKHKLRKELIQVAAVAVAWCEALDAEAEDGDREMLHGHTPPKGIPVVNPEDLPNPKNQATHLKNPKQMMLGPETLEETNPRIGSEAVQKTSTSSVKNILAANKHVGCNVVSHENTVVGQRIEYDVKGWGYCVDHGVNLSKSEYDAWRKLKTRKYDCTCSEPTGKVSTVCLFCKGIIR